MNDLDSSTSPPAVVANFKLPAFSTVDAAIWFKRAEIQFRLKNVKSSTTQADHVLAAVPDTLFPQIAQWLDNQGPDPIKYDALKTFLLKKFSPSPEQRVKQIFDICKQPLGDQRPSDALTELRSLARLPPASDGSSRSIDVILALWLSRLPEKVRASITDFSTYTDDDAIAAIADSSLDAHLAASKTSITASAEVPDDAHDDFTTPDDAIATTSSSNPRRFRFQKSSAFFNSSSASKNSFTPSPSKSSTKPYPAHKNADLAAKLCFYHARFGSRAQKCESPCAWRRAPSSST